MNEEFEYDQAGIDLTVASEGLQLTAYPDPGSGGAPWTIGVGHTGPDVTEGMTITKDEAYDLLRKDIKSASDAVKRFVTVQLNKNQFDLLRTTMKAISIVKKSTGQNRILFYSVTMMCY